MYSDDDLLPISALQHLFYCARRCALIHIERAWSENVLTAEGRVLHERVDAGGHETRGDVRTAYSLRLRSLRLGLAGQADAVEFRRREDGVWIPYPVEFKRGHPKKDECDLVQLCAQALCLEEMRSVRVDTGALFYGKTRHRIEVELDDALRARTEQLCTLLHVLIESGITPPAMYARERCAPCSLLGICLPNAAAGKSVKAYLEKIYAS